MSKATTASDRRRELLEALLRQRQGRAASAPLIPTVSSAEPAPLTFVQSRLWFLDRLHPGSAAYNVPLAFRLEGPIVEAALEEALAALVARHDALRLVISDVDGEPRQSPRAVDLPVLRRVDLRHLVAAERAAVGQRLVDQEARQPFDLTSGPLFRATLLVLGEHEHILQLTIHHIVCDGWSVGVLMNELSVLYQAHRDRQEAVLPPLPVRYTDYAWWQHRAAEQQALSPHVEYFVSRLKDAPATIQLPLDRPRPPVQDYQGRRQAVTISTVTTSRLRALASRLGVTMFMATLSAFAVLLRRYTGQNDLVVGSPLGGRALPELTGLVGFLANVLPLRLDTSADPTFAEFVELVKRVVVEASAHGDAPFEKVVEQLALPRDPGQSPVFQVAFAHDSEPMTLVLGETRCTPISLDTQSAKFDLTLEIADRGGRLECVLESRVDIFEATTTARLLRHFAALLDAVSVDAGTPISRLPLLSDDERRQILVDWNATRIDWAPTLAAELFEARAAEHPRAEAVSCGGERFTYAELDRRANQLAHYLRSHGAGPEAPVALWLNRSLDFVVAAVAALKAGAPYLPLDPAWPEGRAAFVLADATPSILITHDALRVRLAAGNVPVLCVDTDWPRIASAPATPPRGRPRPEDIAYVIYTSGSTGQPKGVPISHDGLLNLSQWHRETFGVGPADRASQVASVAFDACVWEIWPYLIAGASVHLVDVGRLSAAGIWTSFARERITRAFLPTPLAETALKEPLPADLQLRTLFVGGDRLHAAPARALPFDLINNYGPTEASVVTTSGLVTPGGAGLPSIGRPIANTTVFILDEAMQPVPIGVTGELHVGGRGLTSGYLGRPDLTVERFVTNPFVPGGRLYKTGDLARFRPDGTIDFIGRNDHQVKVRGFRIELGEIESVLRLHSAVDDCVVVVRGDSPLDARLVVYVAASGSAPSVRSLREHLARQLPDYMVPAEVVFLDALPLSSSGKVDRLALPPPDAPAAAPSVDGVATGKLEQTIAEIWRDALGVSEVDVHANFFDLGGHSLLLLRVHSRLQAVLARDLSVADLFQYPTVSALARFLSDAESGEAPGPVGVVRAGEAIAIVGMSGRFPGARDVAELWQNLRRGVESVRRFSDDELIAAGVSPQVLADPNYVKAGSEMEGAEMFDAAFFGFSPREAELTDPQHRLFLECAHEALESAGYDPFAVAGPVGVYAGAAMSSYLTHNLLGNAEARQLMPPLQAVLGNNRDFLPSRVSYKLNLRGPSVNVQTACSTSLVAVHMACQAVLDGSCELAVAGGVSARFPRFVGYVHEDGGTLSRDGRCRSFDAAADGTVPGSGVGVVVLKRLSQARADGDTVLAVIIGSAINNDGSVKAGFTVPSVEGQAAVIQAAHRAAAVDPRSISYVEAQGLATPLGDPVEVAALTKAFRSGTADVAFCAIGTAKPNLGHLDTAAGVTGLIKTVLQLQHRELAPLPHFESPNPHIGFAGSPFVVTDRLRPWDQPGGPRRAGVSSFGLGGTNAHVVLEEAPEDEPSGASRSWHVLTLSARTPTALDAATDRLRAFLESTPTANLADVAYTLHVGRTGYAYRRAVVCDSRQGACDALAAAASSLMKTGPVTAGERPVVFLFAGHGAQHPRLALGLYREEPGFRADVDRLAEGLERFLGLDLRDVLFSEGANAAERLSERWLMEPALFVVEYATARLWMSRGVRPAAMFGHGIGEYTAACIAGVMSIDDALRMVAARGRDVAATVAVDTSRVTLHPPVTPFVSSVTGRWITHEEATDPGYWARQLRSTDRFAASVETLATLEQPVFLECGPGAILSASTPAQVVDGHAPTAIATLPPGGVPADGCRQAIAAIGELWAAGVTIDWQGFHGHETRRRVPLPTYPFERQRYFVEPDRTMPAPLRTPAAEGERSPTASATELPAHPRPDLATAYTAPARRAERVLADIWQQLLGVERIGIHDNFFALGGDSIVSLQMIARATKAGLRLSSKQVFQLQTIAELAAVAEEAAPEPKAELAPLARGGAVPLTPIQEWFFDQDAVHVDHFNQAVMLQERVPVSAAILRRALAAVVNQHPALCARYDAADGRWRCVFAGEADRQRVDVVDLSTVSDDDLAAAIAGRADEVQASLDIRRGDLVRAVRFECGSHRPARLLLAVHHLSIDLVSWRIVLEDLQTACEQLMAGQPVRLMPPSAGFDQWARRLAAHAAAGGFDDERAHWIAVGAGTARLTADFDSGRAPSMASAEVVQRSLSVETTRALLRDLPRTHGTQISEAFLAGLSRAFHEWTGGRVMVDMESLGRAPLFDDVDTSRTVGWFTTIYPVRTEWTPGRSPATALQVARRTLAAVPSRGIGFGALKYLSRRGSRLGLDAGGPPTADICFLYLGQTGLLANDAALFEAVNEHYGRTSSPDRPLPHRLTLIVSVVAGAFHCNWIYSRDQFRPDTVERVAELFAAAMTDLAAAAGTTSDARPEPERQEFQLTPMQQGMLFHTLSAPEAAEYYRCISLTLEGDLQIPVWQAAWQRAVERHTALRTSVHWQGRTEPIQVVSSVAGLVPWTIDSWTDLDDAEVERRLADFIAADRQRSFDFMQPPLMRCALFSRGPGVHVFVWSFHHIILDGWSFATVLQEVLADHAAGGDRPPTSVVVPQFTDYLRWLAARPGDEAQQFWTEYLRGFDAPTPLGDVTAVSAAGAPPKSYAEFRATFPADLGGRVLATAKACRVTVNAVLQAAWSLLLSRYSGNDDVVFGAVVSGRPVGLAGVEQIVGMFINSLPVRVQLAADESLARLCQRLQLAQAEAREYEHTPLWKVQGWSQVPRPNPLFDSLVIYENYPLPADRSDIGGLRLTFGAMYERTNYPLTLTVPGGSCDWVLFTFDEARFSHDAIRRMAGHLEACLVAFAANPQTAARDVSLLTAPEQRQFLAWNATTHDYPADQTIHGLIAAQARGTPDRTAVVFEEQSIDYAELGRRATRLARHLRSLGARPGGFVGVCTRRSIDMTVAVLGVLESGAAYLPLDPDFPPDRLAYMLDDAGARILVGHADLTARFETFDGAVVRLDEDAEGIAAERAEDRAIVATPDDPAYLIYTSGSTGRPKGVVVPHRAVVNFLASMQREPGLSPDDVFVAVTTLSFDIAGLELFLPLVTGSRIVIASRAVAVDGQRLAALLASSGATVMQATPATWRLLLESGWSGDPGFRALCGGEALPRDLADALGARVHEVWNLYGPTETTIWSTVWRVQPGTTAIVPIGRPIANTQVHVLDRSGHAVPVGVTGELYIGGTGVARGYWQRPELTAERFVPDPYGGPEARLYRTGDAVRWRSDGSLEYLHRLDSQVKLRGYRIELGEIETVLRACPGVAQSAVVVREDRPGDRRLVAYLVPEATGAMPETTGLRAAVSRQLPDYMVPTTYVTLDALPMTPNGKVDRKALPAPEHTAAEAADHTAPSDEYEVLVAAIFERVLGVRGVDANASFFDLGGHSLLAVRLIAEIEATFERNLPLATLFEAPTVATLTAVLKRRGWTPPWNSLVVLQPKGAGTPFFCVHSLGSNLVSYRKLAALVGDGQPFYGLQPHGLDGSQPPHESVEEMAAHYVREIRAIQPAGPYRVGGVCLGGVVALEMAQQLRAAGQDVSFLGMIDSYFSAVPRDLPAVARRWRVTTLFDYYLGDVLLRSPRARAEYILTRVVNVVGRGLRLVRRAAGVVYPPLVEEGTLPRALKRVKTANGIAERRYVPRPYNGRIHLFWCSELAVRAYQDTRLGWADIAGDGLETHVVPGNHMSMVEEPHVQVLAAKLRRCLERTDERRGAAAGSETTIRDHAPTSA